MNDKVKGDVLFELGMEVPRFTHEEKIDTKVTASAKKKLFGSKISYEDPPEMSEFLLKFKLAMVEALEKDIGEDSSCADGPLTSDLSQAMALFMLDSLDGVTPDDLKSQRNRLIKAFHPDTGYDSDTKYAQKINAAYDLLKNSL